MQCTFKSFSFWKTPDFIIYGIIKKANILCHLPFSFQRKQCRKEVFFVSTDWEACNGAVLISGGDKTKQKTVTSLWLITNPFS